MLSQPAFLHYSLRQLVYVSGTRLALPLIPLYFVTVVKAPDAWIGIIATGQALALLSGYQFWKRQSRIRGTRILLLIVMLVTALYPAALSLTDRMIVVAVLATVASFFSAGVDLILFDELMNTVPRQYGVTFASIDTTLVNMATIVMPLVGAAISGLFGTRYPPALLRLPQPVRLWRCRPVGAHAGGACSQTTSSDRRHRAGPASGVVRAALAREFAAPDRLRDLAQIRKVASMYGSWPGDCMNRIARTGHSSGNTIQPRSAQALGDGEDVQRVRRVPEHRHRRVAHARAGRGWR